MAKENPMRKAQLTPPNELVEVLIPVRVWNGLSKKQRKELNASLFLDYFDKGLLGKLHSASYRNEQAIQKSTLLWCFYCKKVWNRHDKPIEEWVDCTETEEALSSIDQENWTALCPHCGIDSVIADADHEPNPRIVDEMNRYWFGK